MGIDWEKTKPSPELDGLSKSLVCEITEQFLNTGAGIPDHEKRVQLGRHRHLLNSLAQRRFISNIGNKFYPAFAALYYLSPELRTRCEDATTWVLRAFQALYKASGAQSFTLVEIADQINRMSPKLTGSQTARLGMVFTRDFTNYFGANFEYSPDAPIKAATVWDNILDFEDLEQAWQEEVARRHPTASNSASEPPTKGTETLNPPKETETSQDKARRVFVIHGRDERLRSGIFTFLRALRLEPLEWTRAMHLTGKASPYIGEILDAAFKHAQAAVVLLTPDDEARLRQDLVRPDDPMYEKALTGQARPNVLFESGMAFATRPNQTVLAQFGNVRPFSDVAGRHVVRMDDSVQKRHELASKLKTAGCSVDTDGSDWQSAGDLTPPAEAPRPSPSVQKKPNLVVKKEVYLGTLYLLGEIWSRTCPPDLHQPVPEYQVIYAEVKNAGKQGEEVGSAHDVKAELVVGSEEFMPLPWLDHWYNAVHFDFGAVRYVVLAVGMRTAFPQLGDWRVVINHRDYAFLPGAASMDFDHHLNRVVSEQKIRLNLLHVKSGTILNSFEGLCRWKDGFGIPTIYFD
jgi:predicted nucleotide-binding protein